MRAINSYPSIQTVRHQFAGPSPSHDIGRVPDFPESPLRDSFMTFGGPAPLLPTAWSLGGPFTAPTALWPYFNTFASPNHLRNQQARKEKNHLPVPTSESRRLVSLTGVWKQGRSIYSFRRRRSLSHHAYASQWAPSAHHQAGGCTSDHFL